MKIAAVNWKLREISREEEFYDHLRELLDACSGSDLIVLPEFFGLELLALSQYESEMDIPSLLNPHYFDIIHFLVDWKIKEWPAEPQLIVAGSNVCASYDRYEMVRGYYNRSHFIHADEMPTQDKLVLTEWEKSVGLASGSGLVYHSLTRSGITICLDAEFPASGRALAEAGMLFQCVPAWTETMHGFHRVRTACRARAVENQVCVIHSSLVGQVGNEKCVGSSAIIVPPHEPFPEDPILAETPMNEEGIAFAEVDPEDLLRCREMGEVRNWRDRDAGDWTVRRI
jgi:predicted amidohydrolase